MIDMIPLDRLVLSDLNPRKERTQAHIEALAESIKAMGLAQNLIGYKTGEGVVEVIGGGTRLLALHLLRDGGDLSNADRIAVRLYATRQDALQAAIAENEARASMHAMDKAHAYHDQLEAGVSVAKVAAMFGCDTAEVKRIACLAMLPQAAQEACRSGAISVDQARALTIAPDEASALAALEKVVSAPRYWSAQNIRHELRGGDEQRAAAKNLRYLGEDAYIAGGGSITIDLFGDDRFVDDPALLAKLVETKLAEKAKAIQEDEGWAWSSTEADGKGLQFVKPSAWAEVGVTAEESARYDELAAQFEGMEDIPDDDLEWEELCSIEGKMDQEPVWSADQLAICGVVVSLDYADWVTIKRGALRPADVEKAVETGVIGAQSTLAVGSAQAAEKAADPWAESMKMELSGLKTAALQKALAKKPALARAVLAVAAATPMQNPTGHHFKPGDIAEKHSFGEDGRRMTTGPVGFAPLDDPEIAGIMLDELVSEGGKVDTKKVDAVLAHAAAVGLCRLAERRHAPIEAALQFSLRDWWTPDEAFFSRLKTDLLVSIYDEVTGAGLRTMNPKLGKKDAVAACVGLFAKPHKAAADLLHAGIPHEAGVAERAKAWLPAPLRKATPVPLPMAAE